mmetsp:Transcript_1426/g.3689  ORF Transcript_1426/g.3689 Transcript_1426/m.3689 type:complete len:269 (-) Transcript_1426:1026-1832(-)
MDERVRAEALHGHDLHVAAEVARVAARDREPVAEAGERRVRVEVRLGATDLHEALLDLRVGCGKEVAPDALHVRPADAAALVADLDDHVLVGVPVRQDDLDVRQVVGVAVELARRAHAVLEQLEQDVVQVRGHVREVAVQAAVQRHVGRLAVLPLAHVRRVLYGGLRHLRRRRRRLHEPDVAVHGRLPQREVLPDKHADPDARHVEGVEEVVDLAVVLEGYDAVALADLPPQLVGALRHGEQRRGVALVDVLQELGEVRLALDGVGRG